MGIDKRPCTLATGCAFLLLLGASMITARSSAAAGSAPSASFTSKGDGLENADFARVVSKVVKIHASSSTSTTDHDSVDDLNVIVSAEEAVPVADYNDCFKVCCWKGNPECPYPYCNYSVTPCIGD